MKQHRRRPGLGAPRSARDIARRAPLRVPREYILVVCEGAATEPEYFKSLRDALRLSPLKITVCGKECGSDPLSVVQYALKMNKEAMEAGTAFDETWCVMDTEAVGKNPRLEQALSLADDKSMKLALSNPCFEYWILLHHERYAQSLAQCAKVVVGQVKFGHLRAG